MLTLVSICQPIKQVLGVVFKIPMGNLFMIILIGRLWWCSFM